ncbi:Scr1 family TA system antitoxin-like transcriptional regulator [Saccharopolyspora gregorii]|uniref:Scr1 family TA system antitoxin-like transcriptional regulator n=1 Tax=Saccharopolyspora gregorii TaxID=33914 RepID=UPI003CD0666A
MSGLPNISIQVLPFDAGAVPALGEPFIILSYDRRLTRSDQPGGHCARVSSH